MTNGAIPLPNYHNMVLIQCKEYKLNFRIKNSFLLVLIVSFVIFVLKSLGKPKMKWFIQKKNLQKENRKIN